MTLVRLAAAGHGIKARRKKLWVLSASAVTAGLLLAMMSPVVFARGLSASSVRGATPIRPLQLENRVYSFWYNSPLMGPAAGLWNVTVHGSLYKGNPNGDQATWVLYPHSEYVKGPCAHYGGGDMNSFNLLSRAVWVQVFCADATSSGHAETNTMATRHMCWADVKFGNTNATVSECVQVNLAPALNFGAMLAAQSVGLPPTQFGPGAEIAVTGFNKRAIIDYGRGSRGGSRTLRQLVLTLVSGGRVRITERWY